MSNIIALKPPVEGAEPKHAAVGTRMFRRADVMSGLSKLTFYARRNMKAARDEGREGDAEIQRVRLRAFELVRDALFCCPEFINQQDVEAAPRRDRDGGGEAGWTRRATARAERRFGIAQNNLRKS